MARIDLDSLLAVAVEIVDSAGPAELTLSNVAAGLGVRPSALYTHVDGVDGLRDVVAERARANLAQSVQTSAVGVAGADAVASIAVAYREFAHRYPGQYRVSLTTAAPEAPNHTPIGDVLQAVFVAGGLTSSEATSAAMSAHASLHGFVSMEASGSQIDDEHFSHLIELLSGMCA
ncbi:MAG: hypothetical protein HKN24_03570 [Acidimicrobiales bacterium]|nr:hypothetical protein [Acidimicrobiales bacterium]